MSNQNANSSKLREILTGQLGYSEERASELAEAPLLVILAETLRSIDSDVWFRLFEQRSANLEAEIAHFEEEAQNASKTLQDKRAAAEMEVKQLKTNTDPFKPLDQQLSEEAYARYLELIEVQKSLEENGDQFNQLKEKFEQAQKSIPDLVRKQKELNNLFEGDFIGNLNQFIDTLVKLGELLSADSSVISNALVNVFGELTTQRSRGDFDLAAFLQLAIGRSHQLPTESFEHVLPPVQMSSLDDEEEFDEQEEIEAEGELAAANNTETNVRSTQEVGTLLDDDLLGIYQSAIDAHQRSPQTSMPAWIPDFALHNFVNGTILPREPRLKQVLQKIHHDLALGPKQKFASILYMINALSPAQLVDITIHRRKKNMMETRPLKFAFEVKLWFLRGKVEEDLASMISILIDKDPAELPQRSFEEIVQEAESNLAKISTKKVGSTSEVTAVKTRPQTAPLQARITQENPPVEEYEVEESVEEASTWDQLSSEYQIKLEAIGMDAQSWEKLSVFEQSNKLVEAFGYQEVVAEENEEESVDSAEYPTEMDTDSEVVRQFVQAAHEICLRRVTGYGDKGIDFNAKYNAEQIDRITKGKGQWYQEAINQMRLGLSIGRGESVGYEAALILEIYYYSTNKRNRWESKPLFKNFMYAALEEAKKFVKELADGR